MCYLLRWDKVGFDTFEAGYCTLLALKNFMTPTLEKFFF